MKVSLKIGPLSVDYGRDKTPQADVQLVAQEQPVVKSESSTITLHDAATLASHSRTLLYWNSRNHNQEVMRYSRSIMMGKARKLYANDGFTRGAINGLARYAVGPGLVPMAKTSDEAWNNLANDYWKQWQKIADWTGRMSFNRMLRVISQAIDRDGDCGLLMLKTASGFPKVQLIEAHRIGDFPDDKRTPEPDGTTWIDGVRVTPDGLALQYAIINILPDGSRTRTVIDASNFIHVLEADRADQARGITGLNHAINTLHDRQDILAFEKKGVKKDSVTRAVLKTNTGSIEGADWDSEEVTVDGKKVVFAETEGGDTQIIATDEELTPWESNRPNPAFTGFLDHLIRDVAQGLGVPFEFVWSPEKLGGTGNRLIMEQAQRRFNERQDLLIEIVLNRLWFWVISSAIKRGDLAFNAEAYKVDWQRPSEITVDAGRDANQEREDIKLGIMTEAESYSRRGKEWREQRAQKELEVRDLLERAQGITKQYPDVPLQVAVQMLQLATPNGNLFGPPVPDNVNPQGNGKPSAGGPPNSK